MLVISRKLSEQIVIDGRITVTLLQTRKGGVKLGISAPRDVAVHRQEILDRAGCEESTPALVECV